MIHPIIMSHYFRIQIGVRVSVAVTTRYFISACLTCTCTGLQDGTHSRKNFGQERRGEMKVSLQDELSAIFPVGHGN